MSKLKWISDKNLYAAVIHLLEKAKAAKQTAKKEFNNNVVDPFAALFEMSGFEMDFKTWIKSETSRKAQKTLQNHIGEFHQIILGHCNGLTNRKTGNVLDLVSEKGKFLAEVKNKHNTVTGGNLADQYYSLESLVMPKNSVYKGYTAYFVVIIPKKPIRFNIEFTPSYKKTGKKCPKNALIRQIDGASFYSLATGDENALEDLFNVLPDVIYECSKGECKINDTDKLKEFFTLAFDPDHIVAKVPAKRKPTFLKNKL